MADFQAAYAARPYHLLLHLSSSKPWFIIGSFATLVLRQRRRRWIDRRIVRFIGLSDLVSHRANVIRYGIKLHPEHLEDLHGSVVHKTRFALWPHHAHSLSQQGGVLIHLSRPIGTDLHHVVSVV